MKRAILVGVAVVLGLGLAANLWLVLGSPAIFEGAAACPSRDAAIVLGARIRADGRPSVPLEDRLRAALYLWQAGKVKRILVSGDHALRDEDGAMARWLTERGVPPEAILRDGEGVRTRATMENAARRFGIRSAVVCTQRYHLPRALAWAHHEGIDAVGLTADARSYRGESRSYLRELAARVFASWELLTARR